MERAECSKRGKSHSLSHRAYFCYTNDFENIAHSVILTKGGPFKCKLAYVKRKNYPNEATGCGSRIRIRKNHFMVVQVCANHNSESISELYCIDFRRYLEKPESHFPPNVVPKRTHPLVGVAECAYEYN